MHYGPWTKIFYTETYLLRLKVFMTYLYCHIFFELRSLVANQSAEAFQVRIPNQLTLN
jgi:hypothetical protein